MVIHSSGGSINNAPYILRCAARLHYKISSQLTKYLVLEWVGPDGLALTEDNGITLEEQHISTRSLTFHSLDVIHGGMYQCVATLVVPNAGVTYTSRAEHNLTVKSECMCQ